MAVGTVTITHTRQGSIRTLAAACVASSTDGSFPATVLPAFEGRLLDLIVNPGATAPQALYDLTVIDQYGHDVLEGLGANLSATVTSKAPIVYSGTGLHPAIDEGDVLTLTLVNNNVNSAIVDVAITYALGA